MVLVRTEAGLVARSATVAPTAERLRHGDVRQVTLWDETGRPVMVQRSINLVEQLAAAGELGANIPRLEAAADWFIERGERAALRGRMVRSQLVAQEGVLQSTSEMMAARLDLAHAYDRIGGDAFNVLFDTLVWDLPPRGPDRRALFRAALHALAQWVRIG